MSLDHCLRARPGSGQVVAAADNLVAAATTGRTRLRIGHEWSAMDRPIREFQCRLALDTLTSNCT
jgi:hypothetical protein